MARPNKWDELNMKDKLESVCGWAKQGATDEEISKMLGISTALFYQWKKEKVEFMEAIKKGKEVSNGELLNSAFKQATGFYVPTTIVVKLKKPVIINEKVYYEEVAETVPSEDYVPPNPTMNIFMLKNRLPESYKDKHEVDANINVVSKLEDIIK